MTTTISSRDRPRASRPQLQRRRSASPDPPTASHPPTHHLLPPLTRTMDHSRSLPSGLDEFGSVPFTPGDGGRPPAPRRQPSPLTASRQTHNSGGSAVPPGDIRKDLFGCTPFSSQPGQDMFGATPFVACTQNT